MFRLKEPVRKPTKILLRGYGQVSIGGAKETSAVKLGTTQLLREQAGKITVDTEGTKLLKNMGIGAGAGFLTSGPPGAVIGAVTPLAMKAIDYGIVKPVTWVINEVLGTNKANADISINGVVLNENQIINNLQRGGVTGTIMTGAEPQDAMAKRALLFQPEPENVYFLNGKQVDKEEYYEKVNANEMFAPKYILNGKAVTKEALDAFIASEGVKTVQANEMFAPKYILNGKAVTKEALDAFIASEGVKTVQAMNDEGAVKTEYYIGGTKVSQSEYEDEKFNIGQAPIVNQQGETIFVSDAMSISENPIIPRVQEEIQYIYRGAPITSEQFEARKSDAAIAVAEDSGERSFYNEPYQPSSLFEPSSWVNRQSVSSQPYVDPSFYQPDSGERSFYEESYQPGYNREPAASFEPYYDPSFMPGPSGEGYFGFDLVNNKQLLIALGISICAIAFLRKGKQ